VLQNLPLMSELDRQAVVSCLAAVQTATVHASSHSGDLPAYTYRLSDHLLAKAAQVPTSSTHPPQPAAVPSAPTSTVAETPAPASATAPSAAVATPLEEEGLAARVWQALAAPTTGLGTGWDGQNNLVRFCAGGLSWACDSGR